MGFTGTSSGYQRTPGRLVFPPPGRSRSPPHAESAPRPTPFRRRRLHRNLVGSRIPFEPQILGISFVSAKSTGDFSYCLWHKFGLKRKHALPPCFGVLLS